MRTPGGQTNTRMQIVADDDEPVSIQLEICGIDFLFCEFPQYTMNSPLSSRVTSSSSNTADLLFLLFFSEFKNSCKDQYRQNFGGAPLITSSLSEGRGRFIETPLKSFSSGYGPISAINRESAAYGDPGILLTHLLPKSLINIF